FYDGQYNSNVGVYEQLEYTNGSNVYAVNYTQTETVNDNLTSAKLTINGTSADNSISLGSGSFTVNTVNTPNNTATVLYSGKTDLTIDGSTGSDVVTGVIASTISTGVLTFSNVDKVGSAGNAIGTSIVQIELANVTGDVFIDEQNRIGIGQLVNFTGQMTLTNLTGDITDKADLVSGASFELQAQNGSIVLDDNNELSGVMALSASSDITLSNQIDAHLGIVGAQNLTITSGGNITQSGALSVTGLTTLTGNDITLTDSGNDLNSVDVIAAQNVTLTDTDGIALQSTAITSGLTVTAGGDITNSAALNVDGATTLTASGNDITLTDSSNDLNSVDVIAAQDVTLTDTDDIALQSTTIAGDLIVVAGGDITNSGAL
ncbi:MAG: hypothetical protein GY770_34735, partial [Aestuariibacter sp.]|nr:hypothetical protein [Aestuariibacter sp.]